MVTYCTTAATYFIVFQALIAIVAESWHLNFKGNHNTLRAVGQFSNKTEVFSQFALEFQVCVRCAFEGNIARLSAAGNGTLRHHLLFSRRKACYLLLEGVWYDRVRYMNEELFEKYSKVQERRIHHQLMCQPRMSELYVESNGLHSGKMYEFSDEKCFDMDWSPFFQVFPRTFDHLLQSRKCVSLLEASSSWPFPL